MISHHMPLNSLDHNGLQAVFPGNGGMSSNPTRRGITQPDSSSALVIYAALTAVIIRVLAAIETGLRIISLRRHKPCIFLKSISSFSA
jgi:hypothetical protein